MSNSLCEYYFLFDLWLILYYNYIFTYIIYGDLVSPMIIYCTQCFSCVYEVYIQNQFHNTCSRAMRQAVIREAVQKFSESVRPLLADDLYSMRQFSYPILVFKELCYTALFANPGNAVPGNTHPTSALVPSLSSPCTPLRVGQAQVVDTGDDDVIWVRGLGDIIWLNKIGREARGRVEEENRSRNV